MSQTTKTTQSPFAEKGNPYCSFDKGNLFLGKSATLIRPEMQATGTQFVYGSAILDTSPLGRPDIKSPRY